MICLWGQPLEFISECTDKPVEYIREIATEEPMLVREENTYGRYNKKKSVWSDGRQLFAPVSTELQKTKTFVTTQITNKP